MINLFAIGSVALSFAWVVKTLLALDPLETKYIEHYFTWIQSGPLQINIDFAVDRLTAVMLMVVTGVGTLIHGLFRRLHGGRRRLLPVLLVSEPVCVFFMLVLVLAQRISCCCFLAGKASGCAAICSSGITSWSSTPLPPETRRSS